MPELWHLGAVQIERSVLLGSLAKWAVRLSPYRAPVWLEVGLEQFDREWPFEATTVMNHNDLTKHVFKTIERCPTIVEWSQPRKGPKDYAVHALVEPPEPDIDYIDLMMLAKFSAQDVLLEDRIRCAQGDLHGNTPHLSIGGYSDSGFEVVQP
jgi:hypothetical protein